MRILDAKFWQNLTMALVCASFIYANINSNSGAFVLWKDSPLSLMSFLGLGVGMKMVKDAAENTAMLKYNTNGRVDSPD